jgi:DNA-binding GntR family transcriptional regulator
MTAEERARLAAEEEQRKKDEIARKEQERQDRALLNTYANERDIEAMRTRAQNDVQKSIKAAEGKIVESLTRRKKFENEAEFYKKKTLPAEIQKGLNDADFDIELQRSIIEAKQKEFDAIREKYDEDTRRFLDLKRRGGVTR